MDQLNASWVNPLPPPSNDDPCFFYGGGTARLFFNGVPLCSPDGLGYFHYIPNGKVGEDSIMRDLITMVPLHPVWDTPPDGYGFGQAGLEVAKDFKLTPRLIDGEPVDGAEVHVPVPFTVADPAGPLMLRTVPPPGSTPPPPQ